MKTKSNEAKSESDEPQCWIENPQTQILRVELDNGNFHLCPYAWLVWLQFSPKEETDTLELIFNGHIVSVTGKNLRELALAFQKMTVESIKRQPEHRKAPAGTTLPFIQSIQVEGSEKKQIKEA